MTHVLSGQVQLLLIYSMSKELEAMTICTDMHTHVAYIMLNTIWRNIKCNVSWHTLNSRRYKYFFNDRQRDIAINLIRLSTVEFTESMDVVFYVNFAQQDGFQSASMYERDDAVKFDQADWSEDEIRQTIGNLIILRILDIASEFRQLSKRVKHTFIDDAKKNGIEHAAVEIIDALRVAYSKATAIAFIIAGYDTSLWTDAEIEYLKGQLLNVVEYEMLNSAMTALDDISTKYDSQTAALKDEFSKKMQTLRNEELSEKDSVCSRIDRMLSKNLLDSSAKAMIIDIRGKPF